LEILWFNLRLMLRFPPERFPACRRSENPESRLRSASRRNAREGIDPSLKGLRRRFDERVSRCDGSGLSYSLKLFYAGG
jgi:hypothetical protein